MAARYIDELRHGTTSENKPARRLGRPSTTVCRMVVTADGWLSQLRRGAIEYCVLALLRDGERYGYELIRTLAKADGLVTSEGTVYPLLSRLQRGGLVTSRQRPSEHGPPRRYYQLTDEGGTALRAFVGQWVRFRNTVDGIVLPGSLP